MIGLSNALQSANALLPKQHIFLLSHMRSYTSLFGHIMGSNPAICGYYEMHIGYYSWKSLIRQKLLYFRNEDIKPGFAYMFDKVLHNDHEVSVDILNRPRVNPLFCLRKPQDTIPSILKLYADVDPSHDFNKETFATDYYVQRLKTLDGIANSLEREFFYFDAETLKKDSDTCLSQLSNWLQLNTPLSQNYSIQKNTSRERYGDTSGNLGAGRIIDGKPSEYSGYKYNVDTMNQAIEIYEIVRRRLIEKSALNVIY